MLHFYTFNNEIAEREIKKAIPFTIALKIIKYLKITLTYLYSKNIKHWWKELKMTQMKRISCPWIGKTNTLKMSLTGSPGGPVV